MEDSVQLMESTANMLRGMTLDPAIPAHAKDVMRSKIIELEAAAARLLDVWWRLGATGAK